MNDSRRNGVEIAGFLLLLNINSWSFHIEEDEEPAHTRVLCQNVAS